MTNRTGSFGYVAGAASAAASKSSVGWDGVPEEAEPLHVITLVASVAPIPLRAPTAPELAGLAIFRSRTVEDGRERFRLHIGYFPTAAAAEQVLPLVRQSYPAAIVSVAPQSSMGSLDDTAMARFSILRPVEKPAPQATPVAAQAPVAARATAPTVVAAPPPHAPRYTPHAVTKPMSRVSRPGTPITRSLLDESPGLRAAPPVPAPPVLRAVDVVSRPPMIAPLEEPPTRDTQHYAVQLIWSRGAIELAKIPALAIFSGYLLYAVETEPGPRRFFGVRLGFYADALSARLVAQYVRSDFKSVAVVPVSAREMTKASTAAIRLGAARRLSSSDPRARWPQGALSVDAAMLGRAFSPGVA